MRCFYNRASAGRTEKENEEFELKRAVLPAAQQHSQIHPYHCTGLGFVAEWLLESFGLAQHPSENSRVCHHLHVRDAMPLEMLCEILPFDRQAIFHEDAADDLPAGSTLSQVDPTTSLRRATTDLPSLVFGKNQICPMLFDNESFFCTTLFESSLGSYCFVGLVSC